VFVENLKETLNLGKNSHKN